MVINMARHPIREPKQSPDPETVPTREGQLVREQFDRFLRVIRIPTVAAALAPTEVEFDLAPYSKLVVVSTPILVNLHINQRNKPDFTIPIAANTAFAVVLENFTLIKLWVDVPVAGGVGSADCVLLLTGQSPQKVSRED